MELKKEIDTNLGITIILMVSAVIILISMVIMGNELGWDFGYSTTKVDKPVEVEKIDVEKEILDEITKDIEEDENKNVDMTHYVINDDFSYEDKYKDRNVLDSEMNIRTVKDLIILNGGHYGLLSVDNGNLNMYINKYFFDSENGITYKDISFETVSLSYSFEGENVEYVYCDYFMPSGDHVIWVLTDAGNVYLNNFKFLNGDFNTDFFDNFEKKYSNVSDLRIIENIRKNVAGEDYVSKDLAIVVNGEPIEIFKWGN